MAGTLAIAPELERGGGGGPTLSDLPWPSSDLLAGVREVAGFARRSWRGHRRREGGRSRDDAGADVVGVAWGEREHRGIGNVA